MFEMALINAVWRAGNNLQPTLLCLHHDTDLKLIEAFSLGNER